MALTAPVVSCARGSCKFSPDCSITNGARWPTYQPKAFIGEYSSFTEKITGQIVLAHSVTESTNIIFIDYFRIHVCKPYVTLLIRRRNFLPLDFDCEPMITNYLNLLFYEYDYDRLMISGMPNESAQSIRCNIIEVNKTKMYATN